MSSETSGPREESLSVLATTPAPPVINAPRENSAHPAGHLLIMGLCQEGASVEVLTQNGKLGDALVVHDRWFLYRVWGKTNSNSYLDGGWYGWIGLGAGVVNLAVQQTVNGVTSGLAKIEDVQVGNIEKTNIPPVSSPRSGGEHLTGSDRAVVFTGPAYPNAQWDIFDGGIWYSNVASEYLGNWYALVAEVQPGAHTYQVRQTRDGYLTSEPTPPITLNYVEQISQIDDDVAAGASQRPPAPTIETPANGFSCYWGERVLLTGTCETGAILRAVAEYSNGSSVIFPVGKLGATTWYAQLNWIRNRYPQTVYLRATQTVNGSESSPPSPTVQISFELPAPLILFPPSGSTQTAGGVYMSGVCEKDAKVTVLAADDAVLGEAVVRGTTWVYYREWTPGPKHVKAIQTFMDITTRASDVIEFNVV